MLDLGLLTQPPTPLAWAYGPVHCRWVDQRCIVYLFSWVELMFTGGGAGRSQWSCLMLDELFCSVYLVELLTSGILLVKLKCNGLVMCDMLSEMD